MKKVLVFAIAALLVLGAVSCESKEEKEAKAVAAAEKAALEALNTALKSGDAAVFGEAMKTAAPAVLAAFTEASANPGGDFSYELNEAGDGIIILKYNGTSPIMIVPKEIEGYPVVQIGKTPASFPVEITIGYFSSGSAAGMSAQYARVSTTRLSSIIIPDGVKTLALGAFVSQGELRTVKLPDSITHIGQSAFGGCVQLSDINIPGGIQEISDGVFYNCPELYNLVIPESLAVKWVEALLKKTYESTARDYSYSYTKYSWDGSYRELSDPAKHSGFEKCTKLPLATRQRLKDLGYQGNF